MPNYQVYYTQNAWHRSPFYNVLCLSKPKGMDINMTTIPMNTKGAVDHSSLSAINSSKVQGIFTVQNIQTLNRPTAGSTRPAQPPARMPSQAHPQSPARPSSPSNPQVSSSRPAQAGGTHVQTPAAPVQKKLPAFTKPVQKGQKIPLSSGSPLSRLTACFGWNTTNAQCDVDVSAFLLGSDGRVLGDSWFVFYGQTESPDKSCSFQPIGSQDRETISIDFHRLHPDVKKIVFVLTINEAFEKRLHFGMMKDAYIRILGPGQKEIASFQMTDYYSNVISMMIGEIYDYNGRWKFHAVGNGVARDLAGLCSLYGVQVSG